MVLIQLLAHVLPICKVLRSKGGLKVLSARFKWLADTNEELIGDSKIRVVNRAMEVGPTNSANCPCWVTVFQFWKVPCILPIIFLTLWPGHIIRQTRHYDSAGVRNGQNVKVWRKSVTSKCPLPIRWDLSACVIALPGIRRCKEVDTIHTPRAVDPSTSFFWDFLKIPMVNFSVSATVSRNSFFASSSLMDQGKHIHDNITAHSIRGKWRKFGPWEAAIKYETLLITVSTVCLKTICKVNKVSKQN